MPITLFMTCQISDCNRESLARGWCQPHYRRWRLYGDPTHDTGRYDMRARFDARVERSGWGDCWPWQGLIDDDGYGILPSNGRSKRAHRVALELDGIDIDGRQVRNNCGTRHCVNPDHWD